MVGNRVAFDRASMASCYILMIQLNIVNLNSVPKRSSSLLFQSRCHGSANETWDPHLKGENSCIRCKSEGSHATGKG